MVALALGLAVAPARAEDPAPIGQMLFRSANMTTAGADAGYSLGGSQYLGVRFRNYEPWRIEHVGGHIFQHVGGSDGLFVAIIPLDGPDDLPDDVGMSDAYWHRTFEGPPVSLDILVEANVVIQPGWWALVYGGGGVFGSTGAGGIVPYAPHVGYPSFIRMLNGQWEPSNSGGKRFTIYGSIPCIGDTGDTGDPCPEDCFDGQDNDDDDLVDCQDLECWHLVECCDADGDGFDRDELLCNNGPDCDDTPFSGPSVYPGAPEIPDDDIDSNCDGVETCWLDADNDGHGSVIGALADSMSCVDSPGVAALPDDCDDAAADVHPGAIERPGDGIDQNCDGDEACYEDLDGDGFGNVRVLDIVGMDCSMLPNVSSLNGDCRDSGVDAEIIYPGAPDQPGNGRDEDCDNVDACYLDADGDGFGSALIVPADPGASCAGTLFASAVGGDCDDVSPTAFNTFPGAPEIIADGTDQDCDGFDDCYVDADGDGYGGGLSVVGPDTTCGDEPGLSMRGDDCRDSGPFAADMFPDAAEVPGDQVDQDCNGVDLCFRDFDLDGWGGELLSDGPDMFCADHAAYANEGGDCKDSGRGAASIHPMADEIVADGIDQDCDGEDLCWSDGDGDGFGGPTMPAGGMVCGDDPLEALVGGDCDDGDPQSYPEAPEVPGDRVDQDCDGVDTCWRDLDGDGFGGPDTVIGLTLDCSIQPGAAGPGGDCADTQPLIYPGALEYAYDGVDQDCDGADLVDVDGDGFIWDGAGGLDCDDNDASVSPVQVETSDGIDEDCDGVVDEGTPFYDDDGDGVSEYGGDCDDTDPGIRPGLPEICDGRDQDCDFAIDEETTCSDDDGDGYSEDQGDCNDQDSRINPSVVDRPGNGIDDDCDGVILGDVHDQDDDGYTAEAGDCDPVRSSVYPGAPERPDGLDNDCDGVTDEGTDFYDDDGDGWSESRGDCLDTDPAVHPGAEELVNGFDDDCDGYIDEIGDNSDMDGDGLSAREGDCDDLDDTVFLLAPELLDGKDNDCDGLIDEDTIDIDGDGYTVEGGDCNDREGWSNPGADEVCDGLDNDCDGLTDEDCEPVEATPEPSTGCGHAPTGAPSGMLLVFAGMLAGRRGQRSARDARFR